MEAFLPMFKNVMIFLALAIPGYIMVKTGSLKQEQSAVISKVFTAVGMPFLILSGTLGVELNAQTALNFLWAGLLGIAFTFLLYFVSAFLVTKYHKKEGDGANDEKQVKGMERFCAIFSNNGFLGLPLAAAVFGERTDIFAFLVIVNIINNTLMYAIGIYMVTGDKKDIDVKKILFNPVLVAFVVGLVLNLLGVQKVVPEIVTFSDYFKNIVTPLSMFILGVKMAGIKFSKMFGFWKTYYVSFIKLVIVPVICVGITILLNRFLGLDGDMILSMFVAFATPTAALGIAFADRYGGDIENGTIYTLGTTVFSVITIPLLYLFLCLII